MEWTEAQMRELRAAMRTSPVPYIRVKALAVLNVARGATRQEVAALVCAHRASVGEWVRRYRQEGVAGLAVAAGRGRRAQVDGAEVATYLRQSPRTFGWRRVAGR